MKIGTRTRGRILILKAIRRKPIAFTTLLFLRLVNIVCSEVSCDTEAEVTGSFVLTGFAQGGASGWFVAVVKASWFLAWLADMLGSSRFVATWLAEVAAASWFVATWLVNIVAASWFNATRLADVVASI